MTIALLWQRAIPLATAWRQFAAPETLKVLEALEAEANVNSFALGIAKMLENKGVKEGFELNAKFQKLSSLMSGMQTTFLRQALTGRFIAYGFVTPRKPDDQPTEVPADLWQRTIDWKKSEIEGHGLRMAGVRLLLPSSVPQILAEMPKTDIKPVRPGRPSLRPRIEAAYAALKAAGRIDLSQTLSSHFPSIVIFVKAQAGITEEKPRGLSDKLLYKVLGGIYRDDQLKAGVL
ncbi:MAG: hypothetical protein EPN20_15040 [Magnetospirillum sp.]|nr:MAG: hypothetical protein EPN20_15040 [Magnetospirillum sp.]